MFSISNGLSIFNYGGNNLTFAANSPKLFPHHDIDGKDEAGLKWWKESEIPDLGDNELLSTCW